MHLLPIPKELKKTCEIVFKTDFYKKATESGYHKLPLYGKVIIRAAEKNKYALIELCSKLLKLKNMLRG